MKICASLPLFSAIASFDDGLYSSVGSLSGVFLGCNRDGFKVHWYISVFSFVSFRKIDKNIRQNK